MAFSRFSFLFLLPCIALVLAKTLPTFIIPCRRSDPNLEKCLIDLIYSIRPQIADGMPEIGIPRIEPFKIPIIVVDQDAGPIKIHATFKNIVAHGGSNFNLHSVKINFDVPNIFVNITLPKLQVFTEYDIDGRVLILPIKGNGKAECNFTNVNVLAKVTVKYDNREDGRQLSFHNETLKVDIGHASLHFSDLFNGDKELTRSTNMFVNENWRDILEELKPLVQETTGEFVQKFVTGFLNMVNMDDILPK